MGDLGRALHDRPDGSACRGCGPDRGVGRDRRGVQPFPPRLGDLPRERARGATVQVGALLAEAVSVALRAAELTNGAVDPTIGGAVRALGYDRDFAAVRDDASPVSAAPVRRPAGDGWSGTPSSGRCSVAARRRAGPRRHGQGARPPTASPARAAERRRLRGAGQPGRDVARRRGSSPGGLADRRGRRPRATRNPTRPSPLAAGGLATSGTSVGGGAGAAGPCTTSSTRAPAMWPPRAGAPPASWPRPASTRTSPAPRPSSWAGARRAWLAECHLPARLVARRRHGHHRARSVGVARVNQALWFASRGRAGHVLLLTLVAVLGAMHTGRAATRRWPRFAVHALHRNLARAHARVPRHPRGGRRSSTRTRGSGGRMRWCPSRRPTNPSGPGWARPRRTCCWPSW